MSAARVRCQPQRSCAWQRSRRSIPGSASAARACSRPRIRRRSPGRRGHAPAADPAGRGRAGPPAEQAGAARRRSGRGGTRAGASGAEGVPPRRQPDRVLDERQRGLLKATGVRTRGGVLQTLRDAFVGLTGGQGQVQCALDVVLQPLREESMQLHQLTRARFLARAAARSGCVSRRRPRPPPRRGRRAAIFPQSIVRHLFSSSAEDVQLRIPELGGEEQEPARCRRRGPYPLP